MLGSCRRNLYRYIPIKPRAGSTILRALGQVRRYETIKLIFYTKIKIYNKNNKNYFASAFASKLCSSVAP
jgi:hypothetical protein